MDGAVAVDALDVFWGMPRTACKRNLRGIRAGTGWDALRLIYGRFPQVPVFDFSMQACLFV